MGKVHCAVVGLGRIGSLLEDDRLREKPCTHAGAIVKNRECILVAGCDILKERRQLFSRRWRCPAVFAGVGEMLQATDPDIVHVATPAETHLEIIERILDHDHGYSESRGVRLVVCEKPLAENSRDAGKIAAFHDSGRVKVLVNHERRYSKDYQAARDHIGKQTFGELLSVSSHLYMGEKAPAHEILLHDGTHLVDTLQFLLTSELEIVSVNRSEPHGRESLSICCRGGPVPVFMEVGAGRNYVLFEIDLSFSRGRIRIGNGLYECSSSRESHHYEDMNSLFRTEENRPRKTGYFANMLTDAVLSVRERDRTPLSSAREGYAVLSFIDRVKGLSQTS